MKRKFILFALFAAIFGIANMRALRAIGPNGCPPGAAWCALMKLHR